MITDERKRFFRFLLIFFSFVYFVYVMSTKNRIIGIRVDDETWQKLEAIERATRLEKVSIARAALLELVKAFERDGGLAFPFRIVSSLTEKGK